MTEPLITIKRRADFQRVRGGARWATVAFVIETKPRPAHEIEPPTARFGFTVTKQLGGAVVRNRIRRRLKDAVRRAAIALAEPQRDYVVIARKAADTIDFAELSLLVATAMEKVHLPPRPTSRSNTPTMPRKRT